MESLRELESIGKALDARVQRNGLRPLSEPERNVVLLWRFTRELDNGGIDAFFYNASGEHAEKTVDALHGIGATELAELLEEAIALFPDGEVPSDIDERTDALDEISDDAEDVFERLRAAYEGESSERIQKAVLKYWQAQTTR